ncbi:MAG: C40 family peptidase [Cycloclasticus sp.]|nr:C40 family peptidase [Cycloclasticus sp.]
MAYTTGPDKFDCWGLVYHCLRTHYGIELDRFSGVVTDDKSGIDKAVKAELRTGHWTRCQVPVDGAVVLLSRSSVIHHIGISIRRQILHTREGADVCLESEKTLQGLGFKRIEYFVHECHA